MEQVHRRFATEHIRNFLRGYSEGLRNRTAAQETLGIGKTRFFALLKQGIRVSVPAIIERAKRLGYYQRDQPADIPGGGFADLRAEREWKNHAPLSDRMPVAAHRGIDPRAGPGDDGIIAA